jgi:hypothetical protein
MSNGISNVDTNSILPFMRLLCVSLAISIDLSVLLPGCLQSYNGSPHLDIWLQRNRAANAKKHPFCPNYFEKPQHTFTAARDRPFGNYKGTPDAPTVKRVSALSLICATHTTIPPSRQEMTQCHQIRLQLGLPAAVTALVPQRMLLASLRRPDATLLMIAQACWRLQRTSPVQQPLLPLPP